MKDDDEVEVVIVCVLTTDQTRFDDNVRGVCGFCGIAVQHRPHIPKPSTIMCRLCWLDRASPGDEIHVTQQALAEVAEMKEDMRSSSSG